MLRKLLPNFQYEDLRDGNIFDGVSWVLHRFRLPLLAEHPAGGTL